MSLSAENPEKKLGLTSIKSSASDLETSNLLSKIRDKLKEMGNPKDEPTANAADESDEKSTTQCIACLLPIQKGDIVRRLPCCNSYAHVLCMAKIASTHRYYMSHSCPHCLNELDKDEESLYLKMFDIIKRSKGTDEEQ